MHTLEEMHAHYENSEIKPPRLTTKGERILIETAAKYKIFVKDLRSVTRTNKLVAARHECMYRLRNELNLSLTCIGRFMRRDHTTVLHALRKYEKTRQQVAG